MKGIEKLHKSNYFVGIHASWYIYISSQTVIFTAFIYKMARCWLIGLKSGEWVHIPVIKTINIYTNSIYLFYMCKLFFHRFQLSVS